MIPAEPSGRRESGSAGVPAAPPGGGGGAAASGVVQFTWARFAQLGLDGMYDALALRSRVFILEQGPYQDVDGLDRDSWHLLGRGAQGEALAYLRVVDPGLKYDEPSIGRVVVDKSMRGSGLGRVLMEEGIRRCVAAWPGRGIRISAQAHLARFYGSLGFVVQGDPYDEDGIPHVQMWRQP
jgi:ElaA protein